MKAISIYVTHPSKKHAVMISKILLQEKLIACSNITISTSIYYWNDELVEEEEYITIMKSSYELWSKILKRVTVLHEYDVPCICKHDIEYNKGYHEWLSDKLNKNP